MARKTNITGIKRLSIGTTKNDRGYTMQRYTVSLKTDTGVTGKSFYFGENKKQLEAFLNAVRYLKAQKIYSGSIKEAKEIYINYKHEGLL